MASVSLGESARVYGDCLHKVFYIGKGQPHLRTYCNILGYVQPREIAALGAQTLLVVGFCTSATVFCLRRCRYAGLEGKNDILELFIGPANLALLHRRPLYGPSRRL